MRLNGLWTRSSNVRCTPMANFSAGRRSRWPRTGRMSTRRPKKSCQVPGTRHHGTVSQRISNRPGVRALASGKFATNYPIMPMALLVFNVLPLMGQATLNDPAVPLRTPEHRRLATVTKHLAQRAVKPVHHGRPLAWRYSPKNP